MRQRALAALCALFALLLAAADAATPVAPALPPADRIVVEKEQRRLILFNRGEAIKTYRIALGPHPVGPKEQEGDGRTPEGRYIIDGRNAGSAFHKSLHISYPNAEDRARAAARGVRPGGSIMIHGLASGLGWLGATHRFFNWTNGCVAVTNSEIDEIWKLVPDGTPIDIVPLRATVNCRHAH